MNKLARITPPAPPGDDGWNDAAAEANERVIKGVLLKFVDWNWTKGKESSPVADGTRLVALSTAASWAGRVPDARIWASPPRSRGAGRPH